MLILAQLVLLIPATHSLEVHQLLTVIASLDILGPQIMETTAQVRNGCVYLTPYSTLRMIEM